METTMSSSIGFKVLLLLYLCSLRTYVQGRGGSYHVLNLTSIVPSHVNCSSTNGRAHNVSLGLFHRHGPCSPLASKVSRPSARETLLHDKLRIQAVGKTTSKYGKASSPYEMETEVPDYRFGPSSIYVVEMGIGTPMVPQLVNFDTGSSQTWVQCSPCRSCLPQNGLAFTPQRSVTYKSVLCGSLACQLLDAPERNCSQKWCRYTADYGDRSHSDGELAVDVLTFATGFVIPRYVFGCGWNQTGDYGSASGMLGLGRDPISIVSQTLDYFGGVFSYCLPSSEHAPGHLTFGASDRELLYAPLLTEKPTFYYVQLTGISVVGQKLPIPVDVFLSGAGTVIDSGSTLTTIPKPAYEAVSKAIMDAMSANNYWPVSSDPQSEYADMTCYNFTGFSEIKIPIVTLHISGVSIELSAYGVFWDHKDGINCIAFGANEHPDQSENIIGYVNQRGLEIEYDTSNLRIGFGSGTCI